MNKNHICLTSKKKKKSITELFLVNTVFQDHETENDVLLCPNETGLQL